MNKKLTNVDIIIPAYNEKPEALEATLLSCLKQTYQISSIYVVDDGSTETVSIPSSCHDSRIYLIKLPKNQGISVARNTAIKQSLSDLVACINVEVILDTNWLEVCINYLLKHPKAGACFTRILPQNHSAILSSWRMRFQEQKYGSESGLAEFAPGHAVLFRRTALDSVDGYAEHFRLIQEDSDICHRMWKQGWETHYITGISCLSIQEDSLVKLAKKQLVRHGFDLNKEFCFQTIITVTTKYLFNRLARNLLKGRFIFIPIDFGIYFYEIWFAIHQKYVKH